jgi:hypothetical protein
MAQNARRAFVETHGINGFRIPQLLFAVRAAKRYVHTYLACVYVCHCCTNRLVYRYCGECKIKADQRRNL